MVGKSDLIFILSQRKTEKREVTTSQQTNKITLIVDTEGRRGKGARKLGSDIQHMIAALTE